MVVPNVPPQAENSFDSTSAQRIGTNRTAFQDDEKSTIGAQIHPSFQSIQIRSATDVTSGK